MRAHVSPRSARERAPRAIGTPHARRRPRPLRPAGRHQLDRIREQFEAQDAENKRKLDRLNGLIAELGEGKRAMWSVLGQYQTQRPPKAGEAPTMAIVEFPLNADVYVGRAH